MRNTKVWLERFVVACLYGVLLTPLVFLHQIMHPLVIVKTLFFQSLVMFAFAGYTTFALFHKEYRPRITPLFLGVCSLFGVIAVSAVFGVNAGRSIWSNPERMTGIVLMGHLVVYFAMLSGMREVFSWRRYLSVSVGVSFAVALLPVIQLIFPAIFFDRLGDRLSGTIGNPIFLAMYLFFNVFLAGMLAEQAYAEKKRWWPYALVGVFDLVVIILTQTRSALIAIAVSLLVLSAFTAFRGGALIARRAVFGIWALILIFAGVFWVTRANPLWQSVPVLSRIANEGFRADNRLYAWHAGLQSFVENPILGVGWNNFYSAFGDHYDPRLLRSGFTETFFDRPHNVFVQFLSETGIAGFAVYVFLLAVAFFLARRNKWVIALLAAYVTQNFFSFDSVSSYVIFFMILAWIDGGIRLDLADNKLVSAMGASRETAALGLLAVIACAGLYYFDYRPYAASRLEWTSINYLVQGRIPEGLEYMDRALNARTPYRSYIGKDLYPNIALLYKQDLPLPDVRNLIERAVRGMTVAAEAEPTDYGFWIGLADMTPPIAGLDAKYIDEGLAALERADALSPRRQATEYVRAKLLNLKGDRVGAIAAMERAVALDPEVGDAHFYYALLLLESGDGVAGLREIKRAAELGREPRNASEASVAAGQLGDLGAYKESIFYFQKALLMKPDDLELTMKLGLVYYFDGNKDAARRLIADVMEKQDLRQSPQYQSLLPILRDLGLLK